MPSMPGSGTAVPPEEPPLEPPEVEVVPPEVVVVVPPEVEPPDVEVVVPPEVVPPEVVVVPPEVELLVEVLPPHIFLPVLSPQSQECVCPLPPFHQVACAGEAMATVAPAVIVSAIRVLRIIVVLPQLPVLVDRQYAITVPIANFRQFH